MIEGRESTIGYGFKELNYADIDKITPSVILGNGSVRVTTVYNPVTNTTGVSFCPAEENRIVGREFVKDGTPCDKQEDPDFDSKNAKFQILFDNPDSIDVVIARLNEAKRRLLSPDYFDEEFVFKNKGDSEDNMLADLESGD